MGESIDEPSVQTAGDKKRDKGTLQIEGEVSALPRRKIREDTAQHWNYRLGEHNGKHAQFAYYYDETRKLVACKVRFADKSFKILGNGKDMPLYGQWLWPTGGKMVTVVEGEIDALSLSQLQQNKWPVVSIPNGAQSAAKSLKLAMEWLNKFDSIVLMFDMDEPGQKAALECAELFEPGKVKIAKLPLKDPNECLVAGRGDEVIKAMWTAEPYMPDGIVAGTSITSEILQASIVKGYDLTPWPKLNEMMGGLREQELTLLTAGSGIGKSTLARELVYFLNQEYNLTVGNVFLEESNAKTAQAYVAIDNNIPLGKLRKDTSILSSEVWDASVKKVVHNKMYFYNHFGSLESERLLGKLRYMRQACGCNFIVLDHISLVISGQTSSSEGERRDIDILMTRLRQLIEQTGLGIVAIVHLSQPDGTAHEEGGRVSLNQLRGSGALKQLSDNVIALERNSQDEDKKDFSQIRLLKCREFGETGKADVLKYHRDTGRLLMEDIDLNTEQTEF